jgi:ubiquinone/menaquinone biosynthesis C-methylase UbiE
LLYDRLAQSGIFQRHYELVADDVAGFAAQGRLLDIGTGPGWLLLKLHQRAPQLRLTGLDISPAMVRKARANIARACPAGGIEVVQAPATHLPFADGSFEVVVSTGSLHHWKDPVGGVNECHRVLVPGGVALLYDVITQIPPDVARSAVRDFGRYRMMLLWLHSFEEPFYSRGDMADLAAKSKFGKGDIRFVGVLGCLTLRKTSRP